MTVAKRAAGIAGIAVVLLVGMLGTASYAMGSADDGPGAGPPLKAITPGDGGASDDISLLLWLPLVVVFVFVVVSEWSEWTC